MAGRQPYEETLTEAEAESLLAIRLDPNDPHGHAALSMCRVGARDWTGAVQHAARAIELGPSGWLSHCAMTVARASTGEVEPMAHHVDMLRQIIPRGAGRQWTMVMDMRLRLLRGEYEQSAAIGAGLLAERPGHTNAHFMLIASLVQLGRLDEAVAWLARWRKAVPDQSAMFAAHQAIPWWPAESSSFVIERLRKAGWEG
jgi:hypothetical protein